MFIISYSCCFASLHSTCLPVCTFRPAKVGSHATFNIHTHAFSSHDPPTHFFGSSAYIRNGKPDRGTPYLGTWDRRPLRWTLGWGTPKVRPRTLEVGLWYGGPLRWDLGRATFEMRPLSQRLNLV